MTEKIYLNGIPVYREVMEEEESIEYRLFEDDIQGSVIRISNNGQSWLSEYETVLDFIGDITGIKDRHKKGINAVKPIT